MSHGDNWYVPMHVLEEPKPIKQVIVLIKSLHMRRGKSCAQASHSSMKFITDKLKAGELKPNYTPGSLYVSTPGMSLATFTEVEWGWITGSFRKIVCYVDSEQELIDLCLKATEAGITVKEIHDNGMTEFKLQKTFTCAAFGPAYDNDLDPITGHLKLA